MILLEAQGRAPLADLMPSALSVMEAVQNLADVAQRITAESIDEVTVIVSFYCLKMV